MFATLYDMLCMCCRIGDGECYEPRDSVFSLGLCPCFTTVGCLLLVLKMMYFSPIPLPSKLFVMDDIIGNLSLVQ